MTLIDRLVHNYVAAKMAHAKAVERLEAARAELDRVIVARRNNGLSNEHFVSALGAEFVNRSVIKAQNEQQRELTDG